MKHSRLLFFAFLFAPLAWAQTPVLVQHDASSNTRDNAMSSPYCYVYFLPNATLAGNAVVVGITFESNPKLTVTDDKSETYTVEKTYYDSADNQSMAIAAFFNVVGGARQISACFNADPGGYVQAVATELANVTAFDVATSGNSGSGTSVTSGSGSPTVAGDLVYQLTMSLNFSSFPNQTSFTPASQSNIAWSLLSADTADGMAAEYGVYSSTAALNPAMTLGTAQHWASLAVFLKAGQTGSVPTGMRIVHLDHESLSSNSSNGSVQFTNPTHFQIPSSGNLIVGMEGGGNGAENVTGVQDSQSNSWAQAGATYTQGTTVIQTWYAANAATAGNLTVTFDWSGTSGDFNILFYDVAGASTSPLDATGGAGGNQTSYGNLTPGFTVTPAGDGELIFADVLVYYNTVGGMTQSGQLFDADWFSGEATSGPEPLDQNNGWGHMFSTSTSPVNFTWSPLFGSDVGAFGTWASMAAAFKPASLVEPPTQVTVSVQ